jgi:predicted branched-subunit amino acid permease
VLAGARGMVPWLVGVTPLGLVIGVSAARADMPALAGWLTGPLIFAGSAQITMIQLLDAGAGTATVIVAALAVNLRLALYSATMAPYWRDAPRWYRALAPALLVDPSLAVGVDGYAHTDTRAAGHLRYLGGALTLFVAWLAAISVGITVGAALPSGLHLEFVLPLFLIGEVVTRFDGRATRLAVAVAAALGLVGVWVPWHLGALLAIGGGIAAALTYAEPER